MYWSFCFLARARGDGATGGGWGGISPSGGVGGGGLDSWSVG